MSLRNSTKRRYVKLFSRVVATALAVVMLGSGTSTSVINGVQEAFADDDSTTVTYVKDVKIVRNKYSSNAKKALTDEGYTVINQDMQQGAGGDYVYMGYTTTDDKSEAITDLKMMSMNDGYQIVKYSDILAASKENADKYADMLCEIASELKTNYEKYQSSDGAQYPLAGAAWELLNCFQSDGVPLAEFLTNGNATDRQLRDLLMLGSNEVTSFIFNALIMGTADPDDSTWASRAGQQDALYEEMIKIEDEDDWKELDDQYWDQAQVLLSASQSFAELYNGACERQTAREEAGKRASRDSSMDIVDSGDRNDPYAIAEDVAEHTDEVVDSDSAADALTIGAYDLLDEYSYEYGTSGRTLAQFLVKLGTKKSASITSADVRSFFPLVASMTSGQVSLLKLKSFVELACVLGNSNQKGYDAVMEQVGTLRTSIKDTYGTSTMSIWEGIDRDLYEREVAMTSKAYRQQTMKGAYDMLVEDSDVDKQVYVIEKIANIVLYSTMGVGMVASAILSYIGGTGIMSAIWAGTSLSAVFSAASVGAFVGSALASVSFICGIGTILAVAVLIALGIVWLVRKINGSKKPTMTEIPKELYDLQGKINLHYEVAKNFNGDATDINAGIGYQWNALYVSHDTKAGSPLICNPENEAETFKTLTGSGGQTTPSGYTPLTNFEESQAFNMNRYADKDKAGGIYYYYIRLSSIGKFEDDDPSGKSEAEDEGLYLGDVKVFKEGDATAARYKVSLEGYKLFDYNLTPGTGYACYIGYKTTTSEKDAVKDLRIAANTNSLSKIVFGEATYGKAGDLVDCSLFITTNKAAGEPIYADLFACGDRSEKPEGYEPVNLFCGGEAFDLSTEADEENTDWSSHAYLYFHPKVMYTSGTEYISGYAFVEGGSCKGCSVASYGELSGFKLVDGFDYDILEDSIYNDHLSTDGYGYIMYATTYNPKRAITNIKLLRGNPNDLGCPETICYNGLSYAACETFRQWETYNAYHRGCIASNSYVPVNEAEGSNFVVSEIAENGQGRGESNGVNAEDGLYRMASPKAMYVAGPASDATPIKVSDVKFSKTYLSDAEVAGNDSTYYERVFDISSQYPNTGHATNLTFKWEDNAVPYGYESETYSFSEHMYIYIQRTHKYDEDDEICDVKGTYISGLSIFKGEGDSAESTAVLTALAADNGIEEVSESAEVIRTNLQADKGGQVREQTTDGRSTWNRAKPTSVTLLRVTRTDAKAQALRGIIMVQVADDTVPASSVKKGTITYKLMKYNSNAADSIITDPSGIKYAIYATTKASAGDPITNFDASFSAINNEKNWTTATNETGDILPTTVYLQYQQQCTKTPWVTHLYRGDFKGGSSFTIERAQEAAKAELASQGATNVCDLDFGCKYNDSDYKSCYIGYSTSTDKTTAPITDVRCYIRGSDWNDTSMVIDGITYIRETDDINSGYGGDYIYLISTTDPQAAVNAGHSDNSYVYEIVCVEGTNSPGDEYRAVMRSDNNSSVADIRSGAEYSSGCDSEHFSYSLWLKYTDGTAKAPTSGTLFASAFSDNPQVAALIAFALALVAVAAGMLAYRRRRETKASK